jgi:hypothetical protein
MGLRRVLQVVAVWFAVAWSAGPFLDDAALQLKVLDYIATMDSENVHPSHRALAIYHLGSPSHDDSIDVAENNVKLFMSAVKQHSGNSTYRAFYVFNVVNAHANPLFAHRLPDLPNVAYRRGYHHTMGDLMSLVHTVTLIGEGILNKFAMIMYLHSGTRGPFYNRQNGEWWKHFMEPMKENPKLGMIGPTISCDTTPHMQSYTMVTKVDVAVAIAKDSNFKKATRKRGPTANLQQMLTNAALTLGYQLSSIYDRYARGLQVFNGTCGVGTANSIYFAANPTSWCESTPNKLLFLRWGGAPMRVRGYYCQNVIDSVRARTLEIAYEEKHLSVQYVLPETMYGAPWYSATKDYDLEVWRDRSVVQQDLNTRPRGGTAYPSKVCLVVRTSIAHGDKATAKSRVVPMNLRLFIASKSSACCLHALFYPGCALLRARSVVPWRP